VDKARKADQNDGRGRTVRIWFNHWFSAAYHLINLVREDKGRLYKVIGSGDSDNSVVRLACDEWCKEPRQDSSDAYIDWCLSFCEEHGVEIFAPYRERVAVCRAAERFNAIGVKLLLSTDYDLTTILEDKHKTYEYFRGFLPGLIPQYIIAQSSDGFRAAYEELKTDDNRVCFKFLRDRGAKSFRVIDERMAGYESLKIGAGNKISYDQAAALFSGAEDMDQIMVMPYLGGRSISVDCLNTPDGPICIPRYKIHGRVQEVRYDNTVIGFCVKFASHSNIAMPFNLQIKYDKGAPYLLEVNPRMSGGLQMSCLASGVNIPSIAVGQLLDIDIPWEYGEKTWKRVSHIEEPVVVSEDG
jgi:hypothetical protein